LKVIADSLSEFSGEQGTKSWSYGYWDRTSDADQEYSQATDFQLLKHFGNDTRNGLSNHREFTTGKLWYLQDGLYYTSLWAEGGHANSSMKLGEYAPVEHWAVRRWVSTVANSVTISGHVGKVMPWGKNWGGGCRALIVVDGETVFSSPMDDKGQNYSVDVSVREGSVVDFLIGPGPSIGVTRFTATVQTSSQSQ
jgi:hypothetical protein